MISLFAWGIAAAPGFAAASLSVTPISWNVVGLDSNDVASGPNHFPVAARVCNTGDAPAGNVSSAFVWDSANANIALRPGTLANFDTQPVASLAPGACHDFYYEIEINRTAAAYFTARRYRIIATATGVPAASTPAPREIYVERLVSQARNHVIDLRLDGVSIPAGGTMTLAVGNTYTIQLVATTATNGYEQLQSFVDFPNTLFQVLAVSTTYSADTSLPVANPNDKLYGDACSWENDPDSPYYRSCRRVGKVGGSITVTYQVRILQLPSPPLVNPEPLGSLIYDFSGSSFHYNSDYGVSARFAAIVDPSTLGLAKSFSPDPASAGGISALTFTIANPNPAPLSGLSFADTFPVSPGAMVVANPPAATTNGCGAPTFAPVAGAGGISFSGGSVGANSSCTVKVNVAVPVAGVYANTSGHLFVGGADTGRFASDSLTVGNAPPPPAPVCGLALAAWNFASGFNLAAPAPYAPSTTVVAAATPGAGLISLQSSQNHTTTPAGTVSWGSNGSFDSTGALNTGFNDYFQFAVDTTGLSSVDLSFWARRPNGNAPRQVLVYYGTSPSPPGTLHTTLGNPPATLFPSSGNSWESSGTLTFASGLNASGLTYFRVYGAFASNNNPGSDLYLDDVVFTGCGVPRPPAITKSFAPSPVAVGGSSTLTFELTNPNTVAISGLGFGDTLPAGLTVSSGTSLQCGGTLTRTAPSTLAFAGGSLAASASCSVTATVTATTAGPHDNVSGFVASTQTGTNSGATGIATASITAVLPPAIAKSFAPSPVLAGSSSTLTFTITNPNAGLPVAGVAFSDALPGSPGAMVVASPPAATTSGCGAPTFAPVAGASSLSFSGGTIAAGATCIATVAVTAPVAGSYANTSGAVSHLVAGAPASGNTASATLAVTPANPQISLLKEVGPTAAGPWSFFQALPAGGNVFYRFTVENLGNVPLGQIGVSDPAVSTAACSWPAPLPVASATAEPIATCVVGPFAAQAGSHANTATASGSFGATTVSDSATAIYATTGLSLVKAAAETTFAAAGELLHYSYQVTNNGAAPLAGPVLVADDRAADESCPALSTLPPDFDNFLEPGQSLACTATYLVTAADVAAGAITNLAVAQADGVVSNSDAETVTLAGGVAPPSLAKAFGADPLAVGGLVTLSFTLSNPNTAVALTGVAFSDNLPAGLVVAPVPNASANGCGAAAFAPVPGAASVSFAGGTIAAGSSCLLAVDLEATLPGVKNNTTGTVTSANGGAGNSAAASLTVLAPPAMAKSFAPAAVAVGGVATLTFTIANSNPGHALAGVAFADPLPAGLAVAASPNVSASGCGAPSFAPAPGATTVSFSGGSVAAGGVCTLTVDLAATTPGVKNNVSGNVSSTNAGSGNTAAASLSVGAAPGIAKSFAPAEIAVGGLTTLTFTLDNPNAGLALGGVGFTDPLPAGLAVAPAPNVSTSGCGTPGFAPAPGDTSLSFSGGTIAAGGTCIAAVDLVAQSPGAKNNITGAVGSANGGSGNSAAAILKVLAPPSIEKAFTPSAFGVGVTSTLSFVVSNPNLEDALLDVAFGDALPAGLEVAAAPAAAATGCGSPVFAPAPGATSLSFAGGTIVPGGSCRVTVAVVGTTAGVKNNVSGNVSSSNGGSGGTGSASATVGSAPGIAKSFAPEVVAVGELTTLAFTLDNPNSFMLAGVTFEDLLPAGLAVADPPNASASGCGLPAFSPAAGDTRLDFGGGTLDAGGVCQVRVDLVAAMPGVKNNTSGAVGSANGGSGNAASALLTVLSPPEIAKDFAPGAIGVGGASALTLTVGNPNPGHSISGVAFTDVLPAGLEVAAPPNASTTGCGAASFAPAAGATTITFSGGTIAPGGSCAATVSVTATTPGIKNNLTGSVASSGGTGGGAAASLVVGSAPGIAKSFAPSPVALGETSRLTFTIDNPNAALALTGVGFVDSLPAGLEVAAAPNAATSGCGAALFAPAAGASSLALSGATLAAGGSCVAGVDLVATTAGAKNNLTGPVESANGGNGNAAAAVLLVLSPPQIAKAFLPPAFGVGATSTLRFTIANPNAGEALFGVAFSDLLPAGLEVAATPSAATSGCGSPVFAPAPGAAGISLADGTIAAGDTCVATVEVVATSPGLKDNHTGNVGSANGGTGGSAGAEATVGAAPGIAKSFAPDAVALGGSATLTFVLTNPNTGLALTGVSFTDPLPDGLEVASPPAAATSGCGVPTFLPAAGDTLLAFSGGSIAAGGSCSVEVAVVATTSGLKNNTTGTVGSANGGSGNAGSASLAVLLPPGISKDFSPNAVAVGGVSSLVFSLVNPNRSHPLAGVAFSDLLPAGLEVAAPPNASTSGCGAPSFAPAAGDTLLAFAGGTIAAGGLCQVSVSVLATTPGIKNNLTGNVVSTSGGTGETAAASLAVGTAPGIAKSFAPDPVAVGEETTLFFTLDNPNAAIVLTGVSFSDLLPDGLAVSATPDAATAGCGTPSFAPAAGDTALSFTAGTIAAGGSCAVRVDLVAGAPGLKNNQTGPVVSANGGQGNGASATLLVLSPPTAEKSFAPAAIGVGGVSRLTLVLGNPNPASSLAGVAIADPLPAGLEVAAPPAASLSGCGPASFTPAAGDTLLSFSGGTIAGGGSCTIEVAVTATSPGVKNNVTGNVSSANGGVGGTAAASLAAGSAPGLAKAFAPESVAAGETSTLTFTVTNPNPAIPLAGVAFADPLPAGLEVAAPPAITLSGCGAPVFAPAPGDTLIGFSGGTIAAGGTCVASVRLLATLPGLKNNLAGPVTSSAGAGNSAAAVLEVLSPPTVAKAFQPAAVAVGGISTLVLTIGNPNAGTALTGVALTDLLPAGLEVAPAPAATLAGCGGAIFAPAAGDTVLQLANGLVLPGGTCSFTVAIRANTAGVRLNTTGNVTSGNGGSGDTAAAQLAVGSAPGIAKTFAPDPVAVGEPSTLGFTITNPNSGLALTGVSFSDPLPAGLEVADPPSATSSGCGAATFAPAAGDTTVVLADGSIAAGGSCLVSVEVVASTPGAKQNVTGEVSSTNGGTGNGASATLTVLSPPAIEKSFAPGAVGVGGVSTLILMLSNPNLGHPLSGVAFADPLPAGLAVAADPGATQLGCGAGSFAPAAGATTLSFSNGTLAAGGSCTLSVRVEASTPGLKDNLTGNVGSSNGGTGNAAAATLAVGSAPGIAKSFAPDPIAVGGTSRLSFTIDNPNAALALAGVAFVDELPAGLAVAAAPNAATSGCGAPTFTPAAGDSLLSFAGGAIAPGGSCAVAVDVTAIAPGLWNNTTGPVGSTNGGVGNSASATLAVLSPPVLAKAFTPQSAAVGALVRLSFRIANPNPAHPLAGVAFRDPLPAGLEVAAFPAATTSGCGAAIFAPAAGAAVLELTGGTIAAGASCAAGVDLVATAPGSKVNTTDAVVSSNAGAGNAASATLTVAAGAGPVVSATKESSFDPQVNDHDGDGLLSPGDSLHYTIEIVNGGRGEALAVVFRDSPGAYTSLVAGTVTASQGTVVAGNGAGDGEVQVALGNLAGGGQATVSFTVLLDAAFPAGVDSVENQGELEGSNFPPTGTDDPSTAAAGDPTADPVATGGEPPLVEIPGLTAWGLLALALALAALALRRL